MAKDILAFFGLVFLTIIIVTAVGLIAIFYDSLGFVSLPDVNFPDINLPEKLSLPKNFSMGETPTPTIKDLGSFSVEWENPLDRLPSATPSPVPTPTATFVPPLDPAVYRNDVLSRLRDFAASLERWLDLNRDLSKDPGLRSDANWQAKMRASLRDIHNNGTALANVGPAPEPYSEIDAWLNRIPTETLQLEANYERAISSGDSNSFLTAGENFKRIKEFLTHAVEAMIASGWSMP